ncbi:fimbrial protein [Parabacteroides gordonii]|jgi:hypothetical protein|uniref:fimbrial protein n=1 Tax=Parabacteroides gordonii TaxID=574930 RepID=UPI00241DB032|nr:fimbrial protein [Parabacteroides gordonii]
MKRNKIYSLLLSGLLMASCSKEEQPSPTPGGEDALVTVSVAVDGVAKTKAESETQPGDEKENAIKNLTVVFIDAARNEVIGHTYKEMTSSESEKKVTVALKTGIYKMLVMANTKEVNSFIPKDYYDLIASLPEQGGENGFVMSNIVRDVEIKAIEDNNKNENKISETVKRVVGRVDLSKLDVNWKDEDLKKIDGLEFRLTQVFLANVRPKSYLFDMTSWGFDISTDKHSMEIKDGYLCGIGNYVEGGDIAKGNVKDDNLNQEDFVTNPDGSNQTELARFYAMTNSYKGSENVAGEYPVILYIKGDLYDGAGNAVLRNRYYRIKLAKGVQRNTIYKIEVTIEGKGSPEPGDNKDNVKMSVTISVETWEGVTLDTITIDEEIEI